MPKEFSKTVIAVCLMVACVAQVLIILWIYGRNGYISELKAQQDFCQLTTTADNNGQKAEVKLCDVLSNLMNEIQILKNKPE